MSNQQTNHPTTLLLIRHGQTDANVSGAWHGATDSPLNARGQAQAAVLAQRLAGEALSISAIYCSPLSRARETAQIIAAALNGQHPLQIEPGLAEYHLGEWEGLSYEELRHEKRLWERMAENPHFTPPGGESAVQFATRTVQAIQAIAAQHPGRTVLVVSHGGALATALAMLLLQDGDRWGEYVMDNCAISELVFDPAPGLVRFNDISHLQNGSA